MTSLPDPNAVTLTMPDGIPLNLYPHLTPDARGRMVLLHGKGDHAGLLTELGETLCQAGWSNWAVDMRGFGRSPGERGVVRRFEDVWSDLRVIQASLKPQIWCGYSLGSNWVVEHALRHPHQVRGLIVIAPAFRINRYFNPVSRQVLRILDWYLPQTVLTARYSVKKVVSRPEMQAQLRRDPWVHGVTRARLVAELIRSGERCIQKAQDLKMPVLVLYTPTDQIVDSAGAEAFYGRLLGLPGQKIRAFPTSHHDLLHDVDAAQVIQTIQDWIEDNWPDGIQNLWKDPESDPE